MAKALEGLISSKEFLGKDKKPATEYSLKRLILQNFVRSSIWKRKRVALWLDVRAHRFHRVAGLKL